MGTRPGHPLAPASSVNRSTRGTSQPTKRPSRSQFSLFLFLAFFAYFAGNSYAQDLTALETAIRTGTSEQKRDALFQIRNLRSEVASRSAIPALKDSDPIVRATAAGAVVFLPKPEALATLTPNLSDKDDFVRKETAYSLGTIESPDAAPALIELLRREKDLEVKAAIVVAVGQAGNRLAIEPLIAVLKRSPNEDEEFLRRAAARSIGQIAQIIKSGKERVVTPQSFLPEKFKDLTGEDRTTQFPAFSAAVVALSSVLQNQKEADDTRREAAFALGAIGSRSSVLILQTASTSPDPYLAEISREALAKIANTNSAN
jgi:HEAT repeat protein